MSLLGGLSEKQKVILKENIGYPLGATFLVGTSHLATHVSLAEGLAGQSYMQVLEAAAYEPAGMAAAVSAFMASETIVLLMQEKRGGIV